ncbi:MAG: hypothetical protein FD128_1321 [Hyphomonadaceae bacterium]|nr:MAG: hypothetical protein FD128_1321 [Hyphomonadaceae bacterium]
MKRLLLTTIAGLSLISTSAFAQASQTNSHQNVVSSQLRAAEAAYLSLGFRRTTTTGSQSLNDDGNATFNMPVIAGQRYAVLGACDSDCTDLDIKILDASGAMVTQDAATDDLPTAYFEARQTGSYRLQVTMYQCTSNPCYYQATVVSFGTPTPTPAPAPAPVAQNNNYDAQVTSQLDRVEEVANGMNYRRLFRSPMMHMDKDAVENYTVVLTQGVNYKIAGVCDNDCPDMDIKLIDPNGREVAADVLTDSVPIVDYLAARGGAFTVRVVMYNCTSNPCSAGVTVMAAR